MNNDRAWLATRKGLIELRRQGGAWSIRRTHFLGEPVSMLLPPDAQGRMLAALNLGHFGVKLQASDDAGDHWQEVDAPAYPPQPQSPEGSAGPAWTLQLIWSLERAGPAERPLIYAGTLPGGLFVSPDHGRHWSLLRGLWDRPERLAWMGGGYDVPGIHSICPHPQRPHELLLGISCGGVWRSEDAGASWALAAAGMRADFIPPEQADDPNIQDPHRIVRAPSRPEVLWCQHHGGIWRSADNAASWQPLQAPRSSFGFAVAVHPADADTAWFVPAIKDECRVPVDGALVVNRTTDGGASFQTLGEGLPQRDCYDLVYRHGLDVAADGRHLLLASTTGGLWASADGGEAWTTVCNTLPMVYALRFG
ncbi:MAG: exo-alpha-sialidase [Burkholderiaceae bacterium]|nr:exo-alpha-sialidase [Burkholderiaceae bacterium]